MKPRIIFMGTPDFAVPALTRLIDLGYPIVAVVCQPDKPTGRHQVLTAPPVKVTAIQHDIPVIQPVKIRTGEFAAQLTALNPDLIVTAAYGRILPPHILAIPHQGCLNVHGSLLPEYRGAAPVQWCIIDGKTETGITIMRMDEGMDTGDILLQGRLPIVDTLDAGQLMDQLAVLGADLLPGAIEGVLAGTIQPVLQDPSKATYAAMITRQTGLVDWQQSASTIHNLIRGTYPWPGAWTTLPDGRRLKLHRAHVTSPNDLAELSTSGYLSGQIIATRPEGITVLTGDGSLDIVDIQPEGGRRMLTSECFHNYAIGLQLGEKQ
ncbi:MAG: methionyl-tRNA formyltransferase [Eubacteriales bacterium]|nr:methionyl-tRNA formyltransferase [Eubacteriales bacterium]